MSYYSEKLSGSRLKKVYDTAPPRIKQYLEAEIEYVKSQVESADKVLELGCGYGRAMFVIAESCLKIVGVDNASDNIRLALKLAGNRMNCEFHLMNALDLKFPDDKFDVVFCIQNGICAFNVDKVLLMQEALRVTKPGGSLLFSSYAPQFWEHRLKWFEIQAELGLVGEIDYEKTGNNTIVCKDGFRAGAMSEGDLIRLCGKYNLIPEIFTIDDSSIFSRVLKEHN